LKDADILKQYRQCTYDGCKKPWLQMLSLPASSQAQTRLEVAKLLGGHRQTIGPWLAIYASSSLGALLDLYVPAGKSLSLRPDMLAAIDPPLQ
jgi:hypothetical protein